MRRPSLAGMLTVADGGPCGAFEAAEAWSQSRVDGAVVDERAARAGARPGRGQAVGGTVWPCPMKPLRVMAGAWRNDDIALAGVIMPVEVSVADAVEVRGAVATTVDDVTPLALW